MTKQSFITDLKSEMISDQNMKYNVSVTENGALGYESTGSVFADALFKIPSLRRGSEEDINYLWKKLYNENYAMAILFMFYIGDIRGGMGERHIFRIMFKQFASDNPDKAREFIHLIPVYSRWDILWDLIGISSDLNMEIKSIVNKQVHHDLRCAINNQPVSLIGKWLPSYNASSKETRNKAVRVASLLGYNLSNPSHQKIYRKLLTSLRKAIKIVEADISSNNWNCIDYSAVPSKANLKYKEAFIRHDKLRFNQYLEDVSNGKSKINSSVAFPSDIVSKYYIGRMSSILKEEKDPVLEEMWKALPSYTTDDDSDIICVVDTSGSMTWRTSNFSSVTARDVAYSLGIYFSEHDKGQFKNSFITFSESPKLVRFNQNASLYDKLDIIDNESIVANTDIEKVFDLILETAISNHYKQSDIPSAILIISDMEFDYATTECDRRLFDAINDKYNRNNYQLPKLIFWNVNSRTNTIPISSNENGVILVSGYSINTMKMVLSKELDPIKVLMETLYDERYSDIIKVIDNVY